MDVGAEGFGVGAIRERKMEALFNFHCLVSNDEGHWEAHCLELDIVGNGESKESAIEEMKALVAFHIKCAIQDDDLQHLLSAAPMTYWQRWKTAEPLDPTYIDITNDVEDAVNSRVQDACANQSSLSHERPVVSLREEIQRAVAL